VFFTSKQYIEESIERAVKTAAQAALAFFIVGETALQGVDWAQVGGVAAVAALASLLTSLASGPFGPEGTPSVVKGSK